MATGKSVSNSSVQAGDKLVGVMGGTFDPVHFGHLQLAQAARERLALAVVRWVPAGNPPHRAVPTAMAEHRLCMLELALADYPGFVLDNREVLRSGLSYSLLTLEELCEEYPARLPVLILGWDSFCSLPSWHGWPTIVEIAGFAVAGRPDFQMPIPHELAGCTKFVDQLNQAGQVVDLALPMPAVSATQVRERLRTAQSVEGLLPGRVIEYIRSQNLYGAVAQELTKGK